MEIQDKSDFPDVESEMIKDKIANVGTEEEYDEGVNANSMAFANLTLMTMGDGLQTHM